MRIPHSYLFPALSRTCSSANNTVGQRKMIREIPERDWRYLRSIETEMLEELSRRINVEVAGVLASPELSQAEKNGLCDRA